jgi:hypothetical protein
MTPEEEKKLAEEKLKSQQGLISSIAGYQPSDEDIANQILRSRAENDRLLKLKEEQVQREHQDSLDEFEDRAAKKEILKKAGMLHEMDPSVAKHALNYFPALKEMAPPDYLDSLIGEQEPSEIVEETPVASRGIASISQAIKNQQSPTGSIKTQNNVESPNQLIEEESPSIPESQQMIDQANQQARNARLAGQMARVRDAIIGVGAGRPIQTDLSAYKDLEEESYRPIKDVALKQNLDLQKEEHDPNSALSKIFRDSLSQFGLNMEGKDNITYAQLKERYPVLIQALSNHESVKARIAEHRDSMASRAEGRRSTDYFKTAQGIDRMVSQMSKSKPAVGYEQSKQALALLNDALTSKDVNKKVDSSAFFMNYAKTAQGDDSVVRSEDMKVLAGGLGYKSPTELLSKFSAKAEGSMFSPGEMQEMGKVLNTIMKVKKRQLHEMIKPMQKRAERADYDLGESLSQDFIEEVTAPEAPSLEEKLRLREELRTANKQGK